MMPYPSYIQKCSHCGHYFFYEDGVNPRGLFKLLLKNEAPIRPNFIRSLFSQVEPSPQMKEAYQNHFGELGYRELYCAYGDIVKRRTSQERLEGYFTLFIHAYNDAKYGRGRVEKDEQIDEYLGWFEEFATKFIKAFPTRKTMVAELYRELGRFDESIEVCKRCIEEDDNVKIVSQIMAHAQSGDTNVFQIVNN